MTRTMERLLLLVAILTVQCPLSEVSAQIKIAGSVYGGGNQGVVDGSTSVTVRAGDLNNVYGGARMANVGGSASVNIDGENASDNIIITNVYGGNDIAGRVGADKGQNDESLDAIIRTSRSTKVEGGKTVDDGFVGLEIGFVEGRVEQVVELLRLDAKDGFFFID